MFWESLLGAIVGGGLVSYVAGRYNEKGRLAAIREALPDILKQEREKAYEQEAGRRSATHEDIENVLRELGAVTEVQKVIEAKISGDLWNRQMVWNQKRDFYLALIRNLSARQDSLVRLASLERRVQEAQFLKAWEDYVAANTQFGELITVSQIFAGVEFGQALIAHLEVSAAPDTAEVARAQLKLVTEFLPRVSRIAKRDLGIE